MGIVEDPADQLSKVECRTCEQNVLDHYRFVGSNPGQLKITNCSLDEMLNQGPM